MAEIPESLATLFLISQEAEFAHAVCQFRSSHIFPHKENVGNGRQSIPSEGSFQSP